MFPRLRENLVFWLGRPSVELQFKREQQFGVNRNNDGLAPLLGHPLDFAPVKVNVRPGQSNDVGSAHPGPTKKQKDEKVGTCSLFQLFQLRGREWLRAAFRNVTRTSFHPNRIFFDDFVFDANGEDSVQYRRVQGKTGRAPREVPGANPIGSPNLERFDKRLSDVFQECNFAFVEKRLEFTRCVPVADRS